MRHDIVVKDLIFRYKWNKALFEGLSFTLKGNRVTGLLGPNGSGKSTLMGILARQLKPKSCKILVGNGSITYQSLKVGWAATSQKLFDHKCFGSFVRQVYGPALGMRSSYIDERLKELSTMLDFNSDVDDRPSAYSHGTRMKGALILAFLENPDIILLDEPFTGLDIYTSNQFVEFLQHHSKEYETCMFISSHHAELFENLCDEIMIIDSGMVVLEASKANVAREHETLKRAYLSLLKKNI